MVHSSPRITTVNKSAERKARLKDARRPAVLRRVLHLCKKAAFLAVSLSVMTVLFPWLRDTSRSVSIVPRSFLPADPFSLTEADYGSRPNESSFLLPVSMELPDSGQNPDGFPGPHPPSAVSIPLDSEPAPSPLPEEVPLEVLPWVPVGETGLKTNGTGEPDASGKTVNADKEELNASGTQEPENSGTQEPENAAPVQEAGSAESPYLRPRPTDNTFQLTDLIEDSAVKSQYAVLIDAQTGEILAERASDTLINPASMTKVLTLLTAVEALTGPDGSWDLDSTVSNTKEISEYCWVNDCSMAWFSIGEIVPVRDTLYGMILPSGADGALMLAGCAAGSQEALVERMNAKARELGLNSGAHFENCVGLYEQTHVCTVRDMAIIMKAAMDHPVCRTVLGKEVWQTSSTEQHPGGILLVNRFLRRIKDQDAVLSVIGAKTGYVRQAGNCAVSMARRADGREYICVTAKGPGSMQVVRDHAALYRLFCGGA